MVSLGNSEEILLADAKAMLLRQLKNLPGKGNLDEAFAEWLLGRDEIPLRLEEAAKEISSRQSIQMRYQDVALLGYSAASGYLEDGIEQCLRSGISWIIGRAPFFVGGLQAFCTDAIGLLGITLGVRALHDRAVEERYGSWLNQFIGQSFQARIPEWKVCLLFTTCQLSRIDAPDILTADNELADVRIALRFKCLINYENPPEEQDLFNALVNIKRQDSCEIDASHAALRLAALTFIQSLPSAISITKPSIHDVSQVLSRIPAAFRRWTWEDNARTKGGTPRKWHIDNEYHIQNLLYFFLAPIFSDLKEEDYTPSVGQIHPRLDLAIPSLSLIIEVKFMRMSDKPQKMIEQLAADASLYLVQGSNYQFILPFIWDDSCRTQEHDFMRNGLLKINGIVDPIIIARPANIDR